MDLMSKRGRLPRFDDSLLCYVSNEDMAGASSRLIGVKRVGHRCEEINIFREDSGFPVHYYVTPIDRGVTPSPGGFRHLFWLGTITAESQLEHGNGAHPFKKLQPPRFRPCRIALRPVRGAQLLGIA